MLKIALISMPFASERMPSIALAQLRSVPRDAVDALRRADRFAAPGRRLIHV